MHATFQVAAVAALAAAVIALVARRGTGEVADPAAAPYPSSSASGSHGRP
jgi:hypothetical protein